jgi:hypothetical protein
MRTKDFLLETIEKQLNEKTARIFELEKCLAHIELKQKVTTIKTENN